MPPVPPPLVATLISAPGALAADLVGTAAAALPGAVPPIRLATETAVDIPFAPPHGDGSVDWTEAVRAALGRAPVDVVVQRAAGRRKRLLLADMDSTLIAEECIDELAAALGRRAEVAAITRRSMHGEVDFAASLAERVALLRGLEVAAVERIAAAVTPMPGAAVLAATMRAHGATCAIASGGFTLVTAAVAARLGFDGHHANTLEIADGRVTGRLRPPLFDPKAKRDTLRSLRGTLGLRADETMAVGDGANDLPMLREAGLGVAFRARPVVAAAVDARIEHGDLTALLFLQGFARENFVGEAAQRSTHS